MAAPDRRSMPTFVSVRRYITFHNPVRILHQNVSRHLDVRQWIFDEARVLDCRNGNGRSEVWPGGWVCVTVVQSGDGVPGSGPVQGCMSLDIFSGNEKVDSTFYAGNIVSSKTVSSVVTNPTAEGGGGTLLTLVADGGNLHLTKVEHVMVGSHGSARGGTIDSDDVIDTTPASLPPIAGPIPTLSSSTSEERRRDKDKSSSSATVHDDVRRRNFESMNGSAHSSRGDRSGASGSSGSGSGGSGSSGKQKERRRQDEECK